MFFIHLSQLLATTPELHASLTFDTVVKYVDLARLARPNIKRIQPWYKNGPPERLPHLVHEFLALSLGLDHETSKLAWETFRDVVWERNFHPLDPDVLSRASSYMESIVDYGLDRGIGFFNLYPPTETCLDPACRHVLEYQDVVYLSERELKEPSQYEITVFTVKLGAVPGFTTSLYCRKCYTRYHPNYYVHNKATLRTYYQEPPTLIETSDHVYMSRDTCELFANMMVTSWTSATNCSRLYNYSLGRNSISDSLPSSWNRSLLMKIDDVWNGFFFHSLFLDCEERGTTLELQHDAPTQGLRLRPALQERNIRMVGPGQENWNHVCDKCTWFFTNDDGVVCYLRSTVADGITIGHPCCGVHDCAVPLASVKDHFCPVHRSHNTICVVTSCVAEVEVGFRTCSNADHRKLEDYHFQQGKAMFQLKRRLERARSSQTHDSLAVPGSAEGEDVEVGAEGLGLDDQEVLIDESGVCEGKPESGNAKLRARFGRRRTHNEELCVASCGVVLGRATFFGSEAPNGVRTFWMRLFPTKASLPRILWHDSNCNLTAMLKADTDPVLRHYFDGCALPVDVFHFKCKHKESDTHCAQNCNPYDWEELRTPEGKWRFNSSAAEQANAWFGGFLAIVREMQVDRYNFFLDEMIKRRNRMLVRELDQKGESPYNVPRHVLLQPDSV
ncbi:hypothetical protein JAAARDRAFT_183569 [Jaapia argillacea MUCL 33604]|uniref:CxC5 like cysteine cluster associated with KDZ domain-containing protein n=1 Tax=Jaapia argillacea MUCL 33604 TaxID=933084 RepID=A0A067PDY1_9AGAM|nr:hypothetical protein JAAARDRAFT_183569 [Jaapia argillacea MUCL 33604]